MKSMRYVGLDVHKKTIAYCVKSQAGKILDEGTIPATRADLNGWTDRLAGPWIGTMEATLFTGWIYDHLRPHAHQLKIAHPAMLQAIFAGKKKNDRIDARKLADLLRADLVPECYMASEQTRQLRRMLRYCNMIVGQSTRMKNKISGLLMEVGAPYNKAKLHQQKYFHELIQGLNEVPESVAELLNFSRGAMEMFQDIQKRLVKELSQHPTLCERMRRLMTIPGVGEILALTWALEIDAPTRFSSVRQAISYCGLCSAQDLSAGKDKRGPISKQRNKHIQHMLIEAAKLAPRWNKAPERVHERELKRGNLNRETLAVARKLVAYLMAVDKSSQAFDVNNGEKMYRVTGEKCTTQGWSIGFS